MVCWQALFKHLLIKLLYHLTQKVTNNRRGHHSSSKRKIFAFIFFYHYYYGLEAPKSVIRCMYFVIFPLIITEAFSCPMGARTVCF